LSIEDGVELILRLLRTAENYGSSPMPCMGRAYLPRLRAVGSRMLRSLGRDLRVTEVVESLLFEPWARLLPRPLRHIVASMENCGAFDGSSSTHIGELLGTMDNGTKPLSPEKRGSAALPDSAAFGCTAPTQAAETGSVDDPHKPPPPSSWDVTWEWTGPT